jgi:hypothetical protein
VITINIIILLQYKNNNIFIYYINNIIYIIILCYQGHKGVEVMREGGGKTNFSSIQT